MVYPEKLIRKAIVGFYKISEEAAQRMIDESKSKNKYEELCELIELKVAMKAREEFYDAYFG